ncbi:MAG: TetR/AcrR family transcriptional regulator [Actinomycetota bacterium]
MTTKTRAKPLAPEERRSAIIDVVVPMLLEHGRDVTTRQIAERAGIAEGTLFRAFGDKDSIIDAAIERYFDPEPVRRMMAAIDPDAPLREKVNDLLTILQRRTEGVINLMGALGPGRMPQRRPDEGFVDMISRVLSDDVGGQRFSAEEIAYFLRLIAFASSIKQFNEIHPFTIDTLTDFVVIGIGKD